MNLKTDLTEDQAPFWLQKKEKCLLFKCNNNKKKLNFSRTYHQVAWTLHAKAININKIKWIDMFSPDNSML